ncbi:MAG: CBS domain-containing protein [Burkholderiales bacterium]
MQAKDVMTAPVVSVAPDTTVREIARLLLKRGISAVPVLDAGGQLAGIVSEGDLVRRPESGTERRPSWWLGLFGDENEEAHDYAKSHGRRAADVMTRNVVSVDEHATLASIATLLEKQRIKRVPVMRDGKVVGIVSRANLLQGLAAHPPAAPAALDDEALRARVSDEIKHAGVDTTFVNVLVYAGAVHLWGGVRSAEQHAAARIAAQSLAGARAVEDHLGVFSQMVQAVMWAE